MGSRVLGGGALELQVTSPGRGTSTTPAPLAPGSWGAHLHTAGSALPLHPESRSPFPGLACSQLGVPVAGTRAPIYLLHPIPRMGPWPWGLCPPRPRRCLGCCGRSSTYHRPRRRTRWVRTPEMCLEASCLLPTTLPFLLGQRPLTLVPQRSYRSPPPRSHSHSRAASGSRGLSATA